MAFYLNSIVASQQPADAAFVADFVMSCLTSYMTKPTQELGDYAK
jgi:hypothetical protein